MRHVNTVHLDLINYKKGLIHVLLYFALKLFIFHFLITIYIIVRQEVGKLQHLYVASLINYSNNNFVK